MGGNKTIILDASVCAKWFLHKPEGFKAAQSLLEQFIQGSINILVPPHFESELASIFAWKLESGALHAFSQLKLLKLQTHQVSLEQYALALDLMQKHPKTSIYDTLYHALALMNNGLFVTADQKYYKQCKAEGGLKLLT